MFFKKKKKKIMFGHNIEPNCIYCSFNSGTDEVKCSLRKNELCKKYEYDPLKRVPLKKQNLKEYNSNDFSL